MSSILATGIAEAVLELTLYGGFVVVYSSVVYLFWSRGLISRDRPIFFVFLALIVLFLTITAHWINGIYIVYFAFIHLGGGIAAEVYYGSLSTPTSLAHISLAEVASFITDSLVIHRLYVVWSCNRRVIIFPLLTLLCQAVSGTHIIYDFSRENIFNFHTQSNPWVMASLVSSLVISGYCSGMMIYKIVSMSRSMRSITGNPSSGKRLMRVLAIMIESSVIQTAMTICILISFQIGLSAQMVLTALQPVIFGISVVLVHARVGLGWAQKSRIASSPAGITLNVSTVTWREGDLERGKTHL
ncbi:hypothetical protein DFH09DRAFT_160273 [Mycena vulgaris]|nr:hypothetical protein DFH09DRAFT_160273 [Mycena vulgaris]